MHEKLGASSIVVSGVLHKHIVHQFKLPQERNIFYLKLYLIIQTAGRHLLCQTVDLY